MAGANLLLAGFLEIGRLVGLKETQEPELAEMGSTAAGAMFFGDAASIAPFISVAKTVGGGALKLANQ